MDPNAARVHRQQALAAYVEPLAVGRRVAVLGDASVGLGARLAEFGALSVFVWDPDSERARREAERAPHGVIVRALPADELEAQNGTFDLVVISDLELFDDAEDLLARVRLLVGDEGAALVAAPNRNGVGDSAAVDYYELFDLVAHEFDDVTMIAQLPFYGVALAELGDEAEESPTVTVDMQLAGGDRTPEVFVALASQRGVRLDPYAIVELPWRSAATEEASEAQAAGVALAHGQRLTAELNGQIEELRARLIDSERGARGAESALVERTRQFAQRSEEFAQLSEEVEHVRATIEAERVAVAQLQELALRTERELAAAEPELARMTEAHAAELARYAEAHAAELARYEEALSDRAQAMRLLEAELVRRERMIRELVDTLDESAHAAAAEPTPVGQQATERDVLVEENGQLRHKLDALALELARREGEAQASAWSIAELERRLEVAAQPPPSAAEPALEPEPSPELKRHLASALDELDVLRRALAQEHEARLQAEAGGRGVAPDANPHR
jgi:hypothetical protein